jgi:hypothetical protein
MADARIDPLVRSFEPSLRAERKSERTIKTYFEALEQLSALLHERGRGLADATTADIQGYLIDIIEHRRPSTANNRFRALHRFYAWLEDEEEIPNPMRRLKPPPVPEDPVPVLDDEALRSPPPPLAGGSAVRNASWRRGLVAGYSYVEVVLACFITFLRLLEHEVEFALVEAAARAKLEGAVVGVDGPEVSGGRVAIDAAFVE